MYLFDSESARLDYVSSSDIIIYLSKCLSIKYGWFRIRICSFGLKYILAIPSYVVKGQLRLRSCTYLIAGPWAHDSSKSQRCGLGNYLYRKKNTNRLPEVYYNMILLSFVACYFADINKFARFK